MDSHAPEPVFVALSKPVRLVLYRHLLLAGPRGLTKRQMMDDLGFTGGALTSHARVLQDAGLLEVIPETRKVGTRAHHRSGGYRCRAKLLPLQEVMRGLASFAAPQTPRAPAPAPRPLGPSAMQGPVDGHAPAASHAH